MTPPNTDNNIIRSELKYYMKQLEKNQEKMDGISNRLAKVSENEVKIEASLKYLTEGVADIKEQLKDFMCSADKKFVTQDQFKPYKAILGIIGTAAVLNYVNDILNIV